jgi:translation initiation factor 3 subunit E
LKTTPTNQPTTHSQNTHTGNQFDCGNYSSASELLTAYRPLVMTAERNLSVLWGKLAADILMVDYDAALEDIGRLREAIDGAPFLTPLMQLQQRTWLMHWGLHVFWNHENGKNALVDLFLQPPFAAAITVNAQHLLRYLAAAVVVSKRRRSVLKELIRLIQAEAYEYSDPVTQLLECLFVNYDFDGAQQKLAECEAVLDADYFLTAVKAEFVEAARLFIFETYCRIHQCIDIRMLASRLNMDMEAAERWVAGLILNARLNAKIDSSAGTVVMGAQTSGANEALVERAKALSARTFTLANAVGVGAVARG